MNLLEFRDVVKHYPSGGEVVRAVDGVSLTVGGGEFVAIFGPSGSGKTTLLLTAAGLLEPDEGSVHFDGRDLSKLSEREASNYRLRQLGFVRQTFHLMAGATALDNAGLKLVGDGRRPTEADVAARPWLERVGLGRRVTHRPGELSTGECQRVAIARALANGPQVLLADEPTGNLDSQRSAEVLQLLRDICDERHIPVVLVTHDDAAAKYADRVYTLRDGRLGSGRLGNGASVLGSTSTEP